MPTRRKTRMSPSRYLLAWSALAPRCVQLLPHSLLPLSVYLSVSLLQAPSSVIFGGICVWRQRGMKRMTCLPPVLLCLADHRTQCLHHPPHHRAGAGRAEANRGERRTASGATGRSQDGRQGGQWTQARHRWHKAQGRCRLISIRSHACLPADIHIPSIFYFCVYMHILVRT